MKHSYTKLVILFLIVFCCSQSSFAAKTLRLKILSISASTTSGTDCDEDCLGFSNNKIDWVFDIDDGSTDVDEDCYNLSDDNNSNSTSPNFNVWNVSYANECDWPTGNIDFKVEGWDEDCTDGCVGGGFFNTVSDLACTVGINSAFPAKTFTGNGTNQTATCNYNRCFDGDCFNCVGTITVTYRWEASGSFDHVIPTNDNVCNATDLGTLAPSTANDPRSIYYDNICATKQPNEPNYDDMENTMWYKFQTGSGLAGEKYPAVFDLRATDFGADNPNVRLFERTGTLDCSFPEPLTYRAGDYNCSSLFPEETFSYCLEYNKQYFIQAGYHDDWCIDDVNGGEPGEFRINMHMGTVPSANMLCNASNVSSFFAGSSISKGESYIVRSLTNVCANAETNEPAVNDGGDATIWIKLTTDPNEANLGTQLTFDADGFGNECTINGAAIEVYTDGSINQSGCSVDSLQAVIDQNSDPDKVTIDCPLPGQTYYIQIQGNDDAFLGIGSCEKQIFNVNISMNSTSITNRPPNDDLCDATALPTGGNNLLDPNETGAMLTNQKNECASMEFGEAAKGGASNSQTVWYKFRTGSQQLEYIEVDANGGLTNGDCSFLFGSIDGSFYPRVHVFEDFTGSATCTGYSNVTLNDDDNFADFSLFRVECPKPNTTYYVQVDDGWTSTCATGTFELQVKAGPAINPGPDFICKPASSNTPGVDGFLGTLNSSYDLRTSTGSATVLDATDYDLRAINQTTQCLTYSGGFGEPDNTGGLTSPNNTAWYRFRTPAADYPATNSLYHTYSIDINMNSGTPLLTLPAVYIYKETNTTTRSCGDGAGDYANLQFIDKWSIEEASSIADAIANGFDIVFPNMCLDPNSNYYIQVENTGIGDYINFDLFIRKSEFRPADNLCDATDLGFITSNGTATGTPTNINWSIANKFNGTPYFGLPHTNRCASSQSGEPELSNSGTIGGPDIIPPYDGTFQSTVWYKFTTGNTVPDWILWAKDDDNLGTGRRGAACIFGSNYRAKVQIYKPYLATACPVIGQLELQDEMNITGEPACDVSSGIGLPGIGEPSAAPCDVSRFRLKCPQPNTTYYVQFQDAGFTSTCYEGQWSFTTDANEHITTASGIGGSPINDSICNAIDLGTVPNGGTINPTINIGNGNGIFDNFCATPDNQWTADFTQDDDDGRSIDADVWFKFKPPLSGSVMITAQSAPTGSPTNIDDDLDLQIAVWEPILGTPSDDHCDDPRYLWTPLIAQDHGIQEAIEGGFDVDALLFYYDIYNTCGDNNIIGDNDVCNEGNSLIVTCLDPNKYYFIQVDGGEYLLCDVLDAGDCDMGYFKLQIQDANLGLINPDNTSTNISPYSSFGVRNFDYLHDEPCFAYALNVQNSSVSYGSLNWTRMTNRCATSISDPLPAIWEARNSSTDKTVWASFVAPPSGKVHIRAENIAQIKGNEDYHESINLQLALYTTDKTCYDKQSFFYEVGNGFGFDGVCIEELDPTNDYDGTGNCISNLSACGFDEYMAAKCLIPGKTYFIMIDGDQGYVAGADVEDVEGDFRISVQELSGIPASVNDDICDAYNMSGVGGLAVNGVYTTPISFNNECATIESNIEGAGQIASNIEDKYQDNLADLFGSDFDVEHTLWFKFQAPSSGKVLIQALEESSVDDIDLGIAVYDIPTQNCSDLAISGYAIDEDYDPKVILGSGDEDLEVSCLTPGNWYWVQIDGDYNTVCGPIATALCSDPLRAVTGGTGSDCETGQFKVRITHLPADPTYQDIVDYTSGTDLPGGNDAMCNAHFVRNASGTYNPLNQNTFLQQNETITFHHNNRCATSENGEPEANGWDLNPFDPDGDPTVWYAFQTGPSLGALKPGNITIELNNPSGTCFDPDLDLYEFNGTMAQLAACPSKFDRLLRVGEGITSGIFSPREEGIEISCPKPNKVYVLRVLGTSTCPLFGDDQGDYDITISMGATNIDFQTNDNICGATNMGTLPSGGTLVRNNQNNLCATQEINEPNTTQSAVQNEPEYDETVWYKFTTSANPGAIEIYCEHVLSAGIAAIPSITVYRYVPAGNPCATNPHPFTNLADLDSDIGAAVAGVVTVSNATVTLPCVKPNTVYYIQVDGADLSLWGFTIPGFTDNFFFNLSVTDLGSGTSRPINDDLSQAIPADGTKNRPDPSLLPSGGTITVSGHNICATCENGEDGNYCGIDETGHTALLDAEDETVWYYFTTSATPGIINVRVQDDPAVAGNFSPNFTLYYNNGNNPIFRVTQAPNARLIQEGSTSTAVTTTTNQNYTCLLPNTKYYIQVDGNDALLDQGNFIVTVTDDGSGNPGPTTPTNYDLICSANQLTVPNNGNTGWLPRTNKCSWEEVGEPNTSNNMGGTGDDVTSNDYDETVWFTFRPGVTGDITMDIDPTAGLAGGVNYVLYEMPGTSTITCSGSDPTWSQLTEISSGSALPSITLTETFPCLSSTKRYYLQIDGNDLLGAVDVGDFNLRLTHTSHVNEVNDNICGIGGTVALGNFGTFTTSATRTATNQDNRCATQEVGEPAVNGPYDDITDSDYDHTLWYRFVASNTDGTYNISVTNVGADQINAYIGLYRADATVCSGVTPTFSSLTLINETPSVNSASNNETMSLECWEIEEGATYYIQVQGFDAIGGGDVGDNFSTAVQFTASTTNPADNICTAPTANIGTTYTADNRCATTQTGEPNISPSPQDPSDGGSYDETLWYKFVAPASGEVRLTLSNFSVPLLLSVNATLYETPTGYNCATNGFSGLIPNESSGFLTSGLGSIDFRCLSPGETYYIQFDGNDALTDRGTWDFVLTNLIPSFTPPANDEPCNAIDVTSNIRPESLGACPNDGMDQTGTYSISGSYDLATKTQGVVGCDGEINCNDYWYSFVVPEGVTGIRIQGDDEYGLTSLINSSTLSIGAYRGTCSSLTPINCGTGGTGNDIDFTLAAYPGETIYLQMFDQSAPASASYPNYGFCISVDCPPKLPCGGTTLGYNEPQCWNLNTSEVDYAPEYYDCLPGSNNSANYITFHTDCDGTPYDTVQVIFSVSNLGCGATAMSIVQDNTPCPISNGYDQIILNCAVFEEVSGGTTATNFNQTYVLPACATYVMQIIGSENDPACASSGEVLIVRGSNPTTVLPVELLSFTGYNNGEFNILNWTTASEINSNRFEVEKSTDAANFEYIGVVAAAGNSSEVLDYTFNDMNPVLGNNYYRLKMIDNDGSYKYSEVINIKLSDNPKANQDGIVKIYPNPTNGMLNIQYQSSVETDMNLRVFNAIGQTMLDDVKAVNIGMNIITINAFQFAKGMYMINLIDANENRNEIHQAKFIKE